MTKDEINNLVMKFLVEEKGFDLNCRNQYGHTILHRIHSYRIKYKNRIALAKAMIKIGADVNAIDNLGWTPMHYQCSFTSDIEMINVLLDNWADVNAKTHIGATPLSQAILHQRPSVITLLKERGAK